jgi:hypothetical protein
MNPEPSVEERLRAAYARVEFRRPLATIVAGARSRRRARRRAGLVAACGLLVATGLVLWSPIPKGPAPAFGWSPKASPPQPEVAAGITRWCLPPGGTVAALPPLIAVDQRGHAAVGYFADEDREFLCFVQSDGSSWTRLGTAGVGGPLDPSAAPLTMDGLARLAGGPIDITAVRGRAGPGVAAVTVTRDDGLQVQAQVANGFYLAWWPTDDGFRMVGAVDADGRPVARCTPQECR